MALDISGGGGRYLITSSDSCSNDMIYSLYIYVPLWQSDNTILVFSFFIFQTFDVGHIQKMTGVVHTGGGIFTCSSDFQIKVLEPSMDLAAITTLTAHTGEVTNVCVRSEQLQNSDLSD